jgi:hypothetical protein
VKPTLKNDNGASKVTGQTCHMSGAVTEKYEALEE